MFCATIICGPEYGRKAVKIWSWVLFVRPSNSRFMPSKERPQIELLPAPDPDFFLEEGW